jgi:nicotinamide-nucleotide amidase
MVRVKTLIKKLQYSGLTISAAESVSAGYLSYLLTQVPGSSQVFKGSIVCYSLSAKQKFFKIAKPLLDKSQGVSAEVTALLAKRVKKLFSADIGVGITGFAGPSGRTPGLLFIAVNYKNKTKIKQLHLTAIRDYVRKQACSIAVAMIYNLIKVRVKP